MIYKIMRPSKKVIQDRGDTLVEVMLALSVLGMVVVGCMSVMNRLNLNVLDAIERTSVRSDINAQTELINYARDRFDGTDSWNQIKDLAVDSESADIGGDCTKNDKSFYLSYNADTDTVDVISGSSDVSGKNTGGRARPGNGIWIDAVYVNVADASPYIDFYVKACWSNLSNNVSSESSTVTRIYDSSAPAAIATPTVDFDTVTGSATSLSTATFKWGAVTCPSGTSFVRHLWTMTSSDPNNGMSSRTGTTDQYSRQVSISTVTPGYYYRFTVTAECKNNSTGAVTTLTGNTVNQAHPFTAQSNIPQTPNVGVSPSSGGGNRTIQLNSNCATNLVNLAFRYSVNGGAWQGPYVSANGNSYTFTWTPPSSGTYAFKAQSQCQTSSLPAGPISGQTFDSAWSTDSPSVSTTVN